jgi:hypothetical protein
LQLVSATVGVAIANKRATTVGTRLDVTYRILQPNSLKGKTLPFINQVLTIPKELQQVEMEPDEAAQPARPAPPANETASQRTTRLLREEGDNVDKKRFIWAPKEQDDGSINVKLIQACKGAYFMRYTNFCHIHGCDADIVHGMNQKCSRYTKMMTNQRIKAQERTNAIKIKENKTAAAIKANQPRKY